MQSLHVHFGPNGKVFAFSDDGGVTIAKLDSTPTTVRVAQRRPAAVAAFADQVWALDADRRYVSRWKLDGSALGVPHEIAIAPCVHWAVAPTGPPGVLLQGAGRSALIEYDGKLNETPAVATGIAFPITARRHVLCHDRTVRFGNGMTCRLADNVEEVAGSVVLEGTALALLVKHAETPGRGMLVLSIESGRLQHQAALPDGELRIAAQRGIAVVLVSRRRLVAIDLRSGRTLTEVESPVEIDDFAIDPSATRVALCSSTAVQIHTLRDLTARARPELQLAIEVMPADSQPTPSRPTPTAPANSRPTPRVESPPLHGAPTSETGPSRIHPELFELRGLGPPSTAAAITAHKAAALLDRELETVGLWALVAITHGWDTRRIGFANESAHPFEQEVAAILGMNEGHAKEHLAAAHLRLENHERVLAGEPDRRAPTTPLGALAAEFELSPLATDILMIVAAPSLWGEAARLYGVISNDSARALVDELLVQQVLGTAKATRYEVARELEPGQPLCRYGLVQVGSRPRPFAPLSVDPVVLARLRGEPIDFGPEAPTTVRTSDCTLEQLLVPAELVLTALRYLSRDPQRDRHARIALRGRTGSGRRTMLAALAAQVGRDVALIDMTRLPRKLPELLDALRIELRRALLRRLVPCISRLEDVTFEDHGWRDLVADVLRSHPGPVALRLVPGAHVPFEPGHLLLDLPMPNETDRLGVWQTMLDAHGLDVADVSLLAARYRVGPGTIQAVVRGVAAARAEEGRLAGDATSDIVTRMRQTREVMFGEQAYRIERLASWEALVLPEDTMDSLRELVGRVRHRRTVYDRWGFDRALATSRGLTALFQGPPGTGKTLVAGVIARELGLELYQVDLSKIMSKWIGETEKNLGAIFDAAEDGQVVLLFDEADSLFAKRSEVKSSNDRFANLEVNYLLQRLDAFEGIAILTTNFGRSIDPAFKRRLSYRLTFPFPDEETREQLWRVHLPPELPVAGPLDLAGLAAKYQLAGGYIRNACLRAAFLAAEDGRALSQQHLERAVLAEFAELGKLSTTGTVE